MLDFASVWNKQTTMAQLASTLAPADLPALTDEMIDTMLGLIADCSDADVAFVPDDPEAHDAFADDPSEESLAWTLGHVIVHTTASAEESAALACELARGVAHHGRSRSEVPWQTVTSIEQCRERLEESRRMRHASLQMWPDAPRLDNTYQPSENIEPINAVNRFIRGLSHDDSHLAQIAEIVRQAKAMRV